MTTDDVLAAIKATHLRANVCEHDPGALDWSAAWVDPGGTVFGPGPYAKVPIRGGDGVVIRVYAPARLRRRLAALWAG